jgi:hypothetical protein
MAGISASALCGHHDGTRRVPRHATLLRRLRCDQLRLPMYGMFWRSPDVKVVYRHLACLPSIASDRGMLLCLPTLKDVHDLLVPSETNGETLRAYNTGETRACHPPQPPGSPVLSSPSWWRPDSECGRYVGCSRCVHGLLRMPFCFAWECET